MNDVKRRARGACLILLPAAALLAAGCSAATTSSGTPAAASTGTASASASTGTGTGSTPPPAAAASASPKPCTDDACGQVEPVFFNAGSYTGSRPSAITIDGLACTGLTWSSWPSGPGGSVPSASTASATGKAIVNGASVPVTITLGQPTGGTPPLWYSLDLQISGSKQGKSYQVSPAGGWTYVAGDSQFPAAQITASGGNQP